MLGVEHRQMLMDNHFGLTCTGVAQQINHLLNVQVIGWGNPVTSGFQEQFYCFVIGDVQ
ncbi:hypothetical protein D3C76_1769490 [compost metagenome]